MRKTITLTIEINTTPEPVSIHGVRPEFSPYSWFQGGTAYPDTIDAHGCLDAPDVIPAGACWKADYSHRAWWVYDLTTTRGRQC